MKKILILVPALVFSFPTFATSTLKIISFSRVSNNTQNISAEICGVVHRELSPLAQSDLIRLIIDRDGKAPRVYYTYAGQTGIFCSMVTTVEGTVDAAIEGSNSNSNSNSNSASVHGTL